MISTVSMHIAKIQPLIVALCIPALLLCGCAQELMEVDQRAAEPADEIYSFGILANSLPPQLFTATDYEIEMTIINNGDFSWQSEIASMRLCYYWAVTTGTLVEGRHSAFGVDLPGLVAPGELVDVTLQLNTPPLAGRFLLMLDIWVEPADPEEEPYWMSDRFAEARRLKVETYHAQ